MPTNQDYCDAIRKKLQEKDFDEYTQNCLNKVIKFSDTASEGETKSFIEGCIEDMNNRAEAEMQKSVGTFMLGSIRESDARRAGYRKAIGVFKEILADIQNAQNENVTAASGAPAHSATAATSFAEKEVKRANTPNSPRK